MRTREMEERLVLKELFETGKTVDAAIDSACEKLGCSRDDCEWEIIDLPRKGFLGLKNTPAKVRVSIQIPDEKPEPPKPAPIQKPEFKEKPVKPQEKPEKPVVREVRQEQSPRRDSHKSVSIPESEFSEKEKIARDYLAGMLEACGLKADYAITRDHGSSCINILGDGLGMVIGRRGDTLDALQYLAGLSANRGEGEYLRLTVDCGGYRLKRKDTLEALAKKLASQVLKTNVSKALEPMNPFERRIIHATVSEIEGVSSSSVGEEPNRRVIITSPTARPAPRTGYRPNNERGGDRNFRSSGPRRDRQPEENGSRQPRRDDSERGGMRQGRDRDRRVDRDRRGSRPSTPIPQGPPKQTPESEATHGLKFGKIDLE